MKFKVGDLVRVNPEYTYFKYANVVGRIESVETVKADDTVFQVYSLGEGMRDPDHGGYLENELVMYEYKATPLENVITTMWRKWAVVRDSGSLSSDAYSDLCSLFALLANNGDRSLGCEIRMLRFVLDIQWEQKHGN